MKQAIREKWSQLQGSRPEPKVFWGFIDAERNRFLKNYEHGISRTLTVPAISEGFIVVDCGTSSGGEFSPGSPLQSHIASGPYAGRYEKEVAWEAHDWWATYLDEIDRLAAGYDKRTA